jgi:hypothetical protein
MGQDAGHGNHGKPIFHVLSDDKLIGFLNGNCEENVSASEAKSLRLLLSQASL